MNCKQVTNALLDRSELDGHMQHHLDGCEACRGRAALATRLRSAGETARGLDLSDSARSRTRAAVVALLNETGAAPVRAWSLRPIAISGGALAATVVLAVMAINTLTQPGEEVARQGQIIVEQAASPGALLVDKDLVDAFDKRREALAKQVEAFRTGHRFGSSRDSYASRVGRLSHRMAIMNGQLEGELTTYIP